MQPSGSIPLHYKGLTLALHPDVYEPAEDTYFLLDNITFHPDQHILDLGTGCGIIGLSAARQGCTVTCTDLNPQSVRLTYKNYKHNSTLLKGPVQVIQGDLFTPLQPNHQFDRIIFNPPYLPTTLEEQIGGTGWFDKAVDGGPTGLTTTYRFLSQIKSYLTRDGKGYFLVSSHSPPLPQKKYQKLYHISLEKKASLSFEEETLLFYEINRM